MVRGITYSVDVADYLEGQLVALRATGSCVTSNLLTCTPETSTAIARLLSVRSWRQPPWAPLTGHLYSHRGDFSGERSLPHSPTGDFQ